MARRLRRDRRAVMPAAGPLARHALGSDAGFRFTRR
jgi:hypothetical protein